MRFIAIIFFLMSFISTAHSAQEKEENISFGPVYIAQDRMDLDFNDFIVKVKTKINIKAKLKKGSLQWIRTSNNILMPRALLHIEAPASKSPIYMQYNDTKLLMTKTNKAQVSDFFISLLSQQKVILFQGKKRIGTIELNVTPSKKNKERELQDYTCARNNIQITGLEDEYVSVGCTFTAVGGLHFMKSHFQVSVAASNISLINGKKPPFIAQMTKSSTVEIEVVSKSGEKRKVLISSRVPKSAPKLLTAWGTGIYGLTGYEDEYALKTETFKQRFAWPLFLYGKYDLEGGASLKFFNAAVINNQGFFNNFGLYFSYLLADGLDKRLQIQPLLGAQTLTYRITGKKTNNKVIFPQGFEFLLKHGLGIKNNTMALGLFLFPSDTEAYSNMWFRFGRGMFWELNYISYKDETSRVSTFGLSFGIPLATFL